MVGGGAPKTVRFFSRPGQRWAMAGPPKQGDLFDPAQSGPPAGAMVINGRCMLRTRDGHRVVLVAGVPMAHFALGDRMAEAYAMVTLVQRGWADQLEVARAFVCSPRTVRRFQRRFEEGGLTALGRPRGFPTGQRRIAAARLRRVHQLKAQGLSNRAIAQQLGVAENAVRKLLRRMGWKALEPEQAS